MVLQSCAGFLLPFGNMFLTCHVSELGGRGIFKFSNTGIKIKKEKKKGGGKLSYKHAKNLTEDPPITEKTSTYH